MADKGKGGNAFCEITVIVARSWDRCSEVTTGFHINTIKRVNDVEMMTSEVNRS